jgi:superfamily II DNA or RNA helicase
MLSLSETSTRVVLRGPREEIESVRERLRFYPPEYWRSPKYQQWKRTKGREGWDGTITLVKWLGRSGVAEILRGHQDRFLDAARECSVAIRWERRPRPFSGITVDDVPEDLLRGIRLDLDQRTCVVELLRASHGTVEVTVSGGKTAVFIALALMVRRRYPKARFLYITPSERLVRQVVKESVKLAPDLQVSQFGGGKRDLSGRDMVVATLQAVNVNIDELAADGWLKSFLGVLYDEVHHAGSESSYRVLTAIPAFFRFGASDTVKDTRKKDKMRGMDIEGLFGPARHRVTMAPLIELGRVAKPILYLIDDESWTDRFEHVPQKPAEGTRAWCMVHGKWEKGEYAGPAYERDIEGRECRDEHGKLVPLPGYHAVRLTEAKHPGVYELESRWCLLHRPVDEGVIRFAPRNRLVVEWAKHFSSKGWPTLVVATRTLHVLILEALLQKEGLDVQTLVGEDTPKERDEAFEWLTSTPGAVLVSPLVKEGVSLPELKAGVIADYVAGPDVMRQIIGRFIRKKPEGENEAHVVIFVDRQNSSMRRGSLALIKDLEKVRGFTFHWPCLGPEQTGVCYQATDVEGKIEARPAVPRHTLP